MIARLLAAAVTLALAAVLLIACWPQLFGLERVIGVAHLVSLRGIGALVALLLAVLLTLIALLSGGARRFFAGLAALLLAFTAVTGGVLAVRGFGAPTADAGEDDLVVLAWNTLGDEPGAERIAALAVELGADVVALPETSAEAGAAVQARLAEAGRPMQLLIRQHDQISKARSTVLLIGTHLGTYRHDDTVGTTPTLPSVVAVPADGDGPTIIATHPVAPVPGEMRNWRTGLDWLADRCADPRSDVIVAGDLNSTIDHWAGLGSDVGLAACADVARAVGAAAVGTWPTVLPPLLGAPIDHVLATETWTPIEFHVLESYDDAGSDHRPIVARLRPAS